MTAETKVLEEFFSAINRFDVQAIVRDFDPEILRVEPEGHATSGTYRGAADGFVVRDGKIVEYRTFWERVEALEWAGIVDPELETGQKGTASG